MDPYSTHVAVTAMALQRTGELFPKMPIMECGCGDYSTPVCWMMAKGRRLDVYSADPSWSDRYRGIANVIPVPMRGAKEWGKYDIHREYGLCLLDSEESVVNRAKQVPRLLKAAKVVVMHDSREDVIPDARFCAVFTVYRPWTWIGSNTVDVESWFPHMKEAAA